MNAKQKANHLEYKNEQEKPFRLRSLQFGRQTCNMITMPAQKSYARPLIK